MTSTVLAHPGLPRNENPFQQAGRALCLKSSWFLKRTEKPLSKVFSLLSQANSNSRDNSGIFYLICFSLLFSKVQWYHYSQSLSVIPILILRFFQLFYGVHIIYKVLLHFCGHICILNVLYFPDDSIIWNTIASFWVFGIPTSSKLGTIGFPFLFWSSSHRTHEEVFNNLAILQKILKLSCWSPAMQIFPPNIKA